MSELGSQALFSTCQVLTVTVIILNLLPKGYKEGMWISPHEVEENVPAPFPGCPGLLLQVPSLSLGPWERYCPPGPISDFYIRVTSNSSPPHVKLIN